MKDKLRELAERLAARIGSQPCTSISSKEVCEFLSILDAEGDGGAVVWVDPDDVAEKRAAIMGTADKYEHEGTRYKLPLYTHPARSGVVSDEDVRDAARYREQMSKHYIRYPSQLLDMVRYANQFRPDWWMDKESWDAGIDFAIDASIAQERGNG